MAKEQKAAQDKPKGEHQQLLSQARQSGVAGIDWQAFIDKYGPVFTKTILFVLQQLQDQQGMHAKKPLRCDPDQCGSLDEAIEFQAKALVLLVQHRDCCEPTGE
jgi:hypothetical protein